MDHGFSEVINKTKVFELHEKFFQLPFQATKCKLAGASKMISSVIQTAEGRNFIFSVICLSIYICV